MTQDVSRLLRKKADDEWISQTARLRDVDGKWAESITQCIKEL